jgi:hypothetical protein
VGLRAKAADANPSGSGADYSAAGLTYGDCSKELEATERENSSRSRERIAAPAPLDSLRLPFFVIIISFLLPLFATQKDMLTTTTALATALTTGLPLLMKLVGAFAEKRSDVKA